MSSSNALKTRVDFQLDTGMTLAADVYGERSRPAVLFLHGGGQTRHAWGGTAAALAEAGFSAVTVDHRGHGESSWHPEGRYDAENFADDLEALVARHLPSPIVVGASLGGIATLIAHGRSPSPISRGVVLVDVTPSLNRDGILRVLSFMHDRPDGFASLEEVADAIASYMPHRPRPRDVQGLAKNLRLREDGRYVWHWDPKLLATWSPERYTAEDRDRIVAERLDAAARMTVPMMLIRGRMSDVVSEENARELLEAAPRTEYVDLEGAAHMVAGDENDAFTATVLRFVRRVYGETP